MTHSHDFSDEDLIAARKKFAKKVDGSGKAHRTRQKRTSDSVDGRVLRSTGRTEQFNFRSTPELRAAVLEAAKRREMTLVEWMEEAIGEKLAKERGNA
jgi:predicted HicB family RNase H-like nuclease